MRNFRKYFLLSISSPVPVTEKITSNAVTLTDIPTAVGVSKTYSLAARKGGDLNATRLR